MLDKRGFVAKHYRSTFERFNNGSGVGPCSDGHILGYARERDFFRRLLSCRSCLTPTRVGRVYGITSHSSVPAAVSAAGGVHDPMETINSTIFVNSARNFFGSGGRLNLSGGHCQRGCAGTTQYLRVSLLDCPNKHNDPRRRRYRAGYRTRFVVGYVPPGACLVGTAATVALDCSRRVVERA